jgi:hypothetical protein
LTFVIKWRLSVNYKVALIGRYTPLLDVSTDMFNGAHRKQVAIKIIWEKGLLILLKAESEFINVRTLTKILIIKMTTK